MEALLGIAAIAAVVFFLIRSRQTDQPGRVEAQTELTFSGQGTPVDVVGESFYKDNFKKLKRRFGSTQAGQAYLTSATLVNETNNPHTSDGRAIRVEVHGLHLGHIPNTQRDEVFSLVSEHGGRLTLNVRVYFADQRYKIARNSIQLELEI